MEPVLKDQVKIEVKEEEEKQSLTYIHLYRNLP